MSKIQALAYSVVETTDVAKWQTYAEQVLGMSTAPAPDGNLYLKMDARRFRILVVKGTSNRYLSSAWEVADAAAFESTVADLKRAGIEVRTSDQTNRALRCMQQLASFTDPAGNVHELCCGYSGGESAFASPIGTAGFKTGKFGMGHTVLPAIPFEPTLALFRDVLGFGLSDVFNFRPGPDAPAMRIYFLHAASGRHHSLALAEMPNPAGCVHVMVEVNSMTDVGLALDRAAKHGVKMMASLGEHENDRMTSFYMMTPGNFALEYGCGGISVDPQTWQTTQTKQVSIWGHDFSVGFR